MAQRSAALWAELEAATGHTLLRRTGQASLGDDASLEAVAGGWTRPAPPPVWLSRDEARDRFPSIAAAGSRAPRARVGRPGRQRVPARVSRGRALRGQHRSPGDRDADQADAVRVVTTDGHHRESDVAVLCAGPGTLALLGHTRTSAPRPLRPRWPTSGRHGAMAPCPPSSSSGAPTWCTASRCSVRPAAVPCSRSPITRPGRRSRPTRSNRAPRPLPTTLCS